jgi:LemA protein
MLIPLLFIIGFVVVLIWMYNTLIARKNDVIRTFGSIEVLLKKRYDLIPNLVETVKQYMGYESLLLTEVTELRGKAMSAGNTQEERMKLDSALAQKLGTLMVAAENYPDLKANQSFALIQNSWKELEDQIAAARTMYNYSVTQYNNAVEMFPTNIMATMMEYKTKNLFEVIADEKENVKAGELFSK